MNSKYHIIKNFPKKTSFLSKLKDNIEFFVATTNISFRKNLLNLNDYYESRDFLKKGDVVLAGAFRKISHFFIRGDVTHSLMYTGDEELIHIIADGVEKIKYAELFMFYDTLIIVRPKIKTSNKKRTINKAIKFAEAQLGKPYNFNFDSNHHYKTFFCTQLINDSYHHAGFHTSLKDHHNHHRSLLPQEFVYSKHFKVIHKSRTLK